MFAENSDSRPATIYVILRTRILAKCRLGGDAQDEWKFRAAVLPERRSGRRSDPVRGGPDLHRSLGLARRRSGQDREPEERRSRPAYCRGRPEKSRLLLFQDPQ